MNIDEMKVGDLREVASLIGSAPKGVRDPGPWNIGGLYLIRTATYAQSGRLVAVYDQELVLEDAAWIADTGRFADAVASGNFAEVEPFGAGRVIVGRAALIDAVEIPRLPRVQK